jgi:hypothetical protein
MVICAHPDHGYLFEVDVMKEKTCAACDCKLDGGAIKVKLGGQTVEACCEDCARKLNEAHASARGRRT